MPGARSLVPDCEKILLHGGFISSTGERCFKANLWKIDVTEILNRDFIPLVLFIGSFLVAHIPFCVLNP
jgi:hypothetical protein